MADYDDVATLLAARSDPRAFEVFYRRHALAVEHWLRRQVGDRDIAAELTAETFACAPAGLARPTGGYWVDEQPVTPHRKALNDGLAAGLCERSAALVGADLPVVSA